MTAVGDTRLVSVIIPCYKHVRFLPEAIQSALAQDHEHIEVVVVDDGAGDCVKRVTQAFPGVVCITQSNRGVAAARNAGFARSRGAFVLFLDDDDRLMPDAVRQQLAVLEADVEASAAVGRCRIIGEEGCPLPFAQQPFVPEDAYLELLAENFIWMPAQVLYRREPLVASGGFDSSINECADYDLYLRMARDGKLTCHARVVAEYRQHSENMSRDARAMLAASLTALARQEPYARTRAPYRAAIAHGRRFWRHYYGDQVVADIRRRWHTPGERTAIMRAVLTLVRYDPVSVAIHVARALRVRAGFGRRILP